jgi:hypothetical protein
VPIEVMSVRDIYSVDETRTIKLLILGPPGAGKTLFASTFPKPLYVDMEGRLLSIRDRDCRRTRVTSLEQLEEVKAALDQRREVRERLLGPVGTVVLDTVDELARIIIKERLVSEKLEAMRQQDWGYLGDTLRDILRGFRNLSDLHVIFNCHLKMVTDDDSGRSWMRPDIQGAVGNEIPAYTDEVLLLRALPSVNPTTGERTITRHLQTYPDKMHEWIKDHSGTLPMEFPVNFTDDYQRLSAFIFGAPAHTAPTPPQVEPTAAQVVPAETPVTPAPPPASEPVAASAPETVTKPSSVGVPEEGTENETPVTPPAKEEPTVYICADCKEEINNPEIAEVAQIRYGVPLCRADFRARVAAKAH